MLLEWRLCFIVPNKLVDKISLVGRSMQKIYKAARQCGYLKDIIEPIDLRKAKKISREKNYLFMHRKSR